MMAKNEKKKKKTPDKALLFLFTQNCEENNKERLKGISWQTSNISSIIRRFTAR